MYYEFHTQTCLIISYTDLLIKYNNKWMATNMFWLQFNNMLYALCAATLSLVRITFPTYVSYKCKLHNAQHKWVTTCVYSLDYSRLCFILCTMYTDVLSFRQNWSYITQWDGYILNFTYSSVWLKINKWSPIYFGCKFAHWSAIFGLVRITYPTHHTNIMHSIHW